MPFRPKHMRQFSEAELEALERLNLGGTDSPNSPLRSSMTQAEVSSPSSFNMATHSSSVAATKIDIALLEKQAEATNGHHGQE